VPRQIAELPSIASLLQRLHSLDNLRLGCRGHMTAIRASLIRETNCDASMPTPVAAFVDRRAPVPLTAPRHPAPAPLPLQGSSRKVTKASAGTRRKRPIRTDSTAPELTSAYMTVLPTPSRSAASSTVNTSGNLSSSSWGLWLAEPSASLGWRALRVRSAHMPNPFRPQSRGEGLHATRSRLAAAPYRRSVPPQTSPWRRWPSPSSQKRRQWAHTPLTCG
jgi:hypothetical protein